MKPKHFPGEFIPHYGYAIPSVLTIDDEGQLYLKLDQGADKWYCVGNLQNHKTPDVDDDEYEGEEWTKENWEDWIKMVSEQIDEQECISL